MTSVPLEQYLAAMHTQSVTFDWDVAVTYDEAKINALLTERYNQSGGSGLATQIDIQEKVEDRYGEYYQNYHFNLGPPLINFEGTATYATCGLKTAIVSGSIWTSEINNPDSKQDEQQLDPNTYWITFSGISLSAIDGNGNYIAGGRDTITFPSDAESDRYIVLDIPTSGILLQYSVDYPSGYSPPFAMKTDNLLTALRDFFKTKVNRMAYTLAQINNYKPTNGVLDLVPQAFRFANWTSNAPSAPAFLTLLIQTRSGSGPGLTQDIISFWTSVWSYDLGVAPVPKDQSASIIINNTFFLQAFIKPGVSQATSVTEIAVPSSDSVGGIRAQCMWPKQTREQYDYRNSSIPTDWNSWPLDYEWSELHVPAVTYDPNNGGTPLTLTFSHSNGFGRPATLRIYWQYAYKSTWTGKQVKRYAMFDPEGPMVWMPSTKDYYGSYNTTYTLDKTIELTNLTDEDLSINVGVNPGDWKINTVPDEGGDFWEQIGQIFGGAYNPGTIPDWVNHSTMGGISFSFNFGTLRFFSVTNVLLPGEKVIEVNVKNGLGIPRDCVVVGNVVESRSKFRNLKY